MFRHRKRVADLARNILRPTQLAETRSFFSSSRDSEGDWRSRYLAPTLAFGVLAGLAFYQMSPAQAEESKPPSLRPGGTPQPETQPPQFNVKKKLDDSL